LPSLRTLVDVIYVQCEYVM